MNKIEQYFLGKKRIEDEKARLLVRFILVTFILPVGYILCSDITGFKAANPIGLIVISGMIIILIWVKANLNIKIATQFFLFLCWFSVATVSYLSGGIESYAIGWFYGLSILSLLISQKTSAIVWTLISLITVFALFWLDGTIFPSGNLPFSTTHEFIVALHVGVILYMLIITYMFDQQKDNMIKIISNLLNKSEENQSLIVKNNEELKRANQLIEKQQEEIIHKNKNLEKEVAIRSEKIIKYNAQLKDFAFMSSHNLRSPVAKILGIGDILQTDIDQEQKELFLEKLFEATKDLDRVVKDMGQILESTNRSKTKMESVSLDHCIDRAEHHLSDKIAKKQAVIKKEISEVPTVTAIKTYIESILQNLIENAIKYSHPDRNPEITITSHENDHYSIITIADNGIGIDLENHGDKIFKLYERLSSREKGDGIGLYLVKSQMESMEGEVKVASRIGEGTTFSLKFKKRTAAP